VKIYGALLGFSVAAIAAIAGESGIFGRAINAQTHEPVRRAIIKIYTPKQQWDEFTDGEGRFRFPQLVRAEYTLIGHRDGYTDRAYKVELSDFDEGKELAIELRPQGLVTGKVVNGSGHPLQRARIEALDSRNSNGQIQAVSNAETNDVGEYRLSGLDPGTYRLRATYREGREDEFDPTPMTTATSYLGGKEKPAEIVVTSGSVNRGIDFVLNDVRPATVRGTLRTESGVVHERATLWIASQTGEGGHNGFGQDGRFAIGDVGPGTYTISAHTIDERTRQFGTTSVTVKDSDVDGIEILLQPGLKLEGQIRGLTEQQIENSKIGSVYFNRRPGLLNPMDFGSAKADADGTFAVSLEPGEYTISVDPRLGKLQSGTLDSKPIVNWKIKMEPGTAGKRLILVVQPEAQQ
jgi:hypothetical protein